VLLIIYNSASKYASINLAYKNYLILVNKSIHFF